MGDNWAGKLGIRDFLAYLLPGFVGLVGLLFLDRALINSAFAGFAANRGQAFSVVFMLVASYAIGVVTSAAVQLRRLEERIYRSTSFEGPLASVPRCLAQHFAKRVAHYYGLDTEHQAQAGWRSFIDAKPDPDSPLQLSEIPLSLFYIARALLRECSQATLQDMGRASHLRQARRNLLFPVGITGASSVILACSYLGPNHSLAAALCSILLLGATYVVLRVLVVGMISSRQRETQNLILGFLAADRLNLLAPRTVKREDA